MSRDNHLENQEDISCVDAEISNIPMVDTCTDNVVHNNHSLATVSTPPFSAEFLCGWLNVWAIDGSRSVNEIFNLSAPGPHYPEWEPLFVVFCTKTGQLSHFLTEQYAEEFYRFTDNISLLGLNLDEEGDSAGLTSVVTRRLDGGKAQFMARWGYESLENLHDRFAKSANTALDEIDSSSPFLDNTAFDFEEQVSSANALVKSEHCQNFEASPIATKPYQNSLGRPCQRGPGRLRRDISCSMDVLYVQQQSQTTPGTSSGASKAVNKALTFGRSIFTPQATTDQPHVRRPSFRHLKAFLNQHSLSANRASSSNSNNNNNNNTSTPESSSNYGWGPFSGLRIRRAKSQAKLQQQQSQLPNHPQIHCISSSIAGFQSPSDRPSTPDKWRTSEGCYQNPSFRLSSTSRPSSSLFGSQLTMTTLDLNDADNVHIRSVHPTLLNGQCFQVNSVNSPQTHFYACKSPAEGRAWLWELSNYSLASMPYHSPSPTVSGLDKNNRSNYEQMTKSTPATQLKPFPAHSQGRTRMVNTLKLSVLEAVNLPQKYKYYCDIYVDEILYARTTSKHRHELLFWGENFEFGQLPAVQFVHLKLYRESPATSKKASKNSLLGSVQVPIADISGRQLIDRWYPISVESKIRRRIFGQRNSTVVNVRIRGRYQSTVVLPQPNYRDLIDFVANNYCWIVESFEPAIPVRLKEELASCLVNILQSRGSVVDFLVSSALAEVARTSSENEALAFRGNSIASKAFECYLKLIGERYLFDLLSGFVQAVVRSCDDCEVDPAKMNAGQSESTSNQQQNSASLDRNRFNLVSYCEMVWRKVLQSAQWFPVELRAVFAELREQLAHKPGLCDNIISACFFLRFLCPAILSPSLFGLCQEYPAERASRTFTLVAKTIQSLANFARFGTKEEYMSFMNSFVEREATNVRHFLHNISSLPQENVPNQPHHQHGGPFIDVSYHSSLLHDVMCECIAFLPKLTASRGDRNDSPRSDESEIARHFELQAILDRLTEDLSSSSLTATTSATNLNYAARTQTLPGNGRPNIPSLVAYDNVVVYPNETSFNTFPHKPQTSNLPQFVQPATVLASSQLRAKSTAHVTAVPHVTTTEEGVTVSVVTTRNQPGSSFTLSPATSRRNNGQFYSGSKTLERRHPYHSPWQNVTPQQRTAALKSSPERELEKSWNQLIAAAEMLNVESSPKKRSNLKQQPKMGTLTTGEPTTTTNHSPTTRFSTLTSGYQSSSMSSSNSNSPTQTGDYSVAKSKKAALRLSLPVGGNEPDYSIVSAHDIVADDVFNSSHSPLINAAEMCEMLGPDFDTDLLIVNSPEKNGQVKQMKISESEDSEDSQHVSSVLDNLIHLEQELKQEHAAILKSSADRQWLLENGQRCVGSLLEALTKLRKHCEQISTIECPAEPLRHRASSSPTPMSSHRLGQRHRATTSTSSCGTTQMRKESHL